MKKKPTSKIEYSGSLEGYQIYRNNLYTKYEVDTYSPYQNARYKRALYGLKGISKQELNAMCSKKKKRKIPLFHPNKYPNKYAALACDH